MLTLYCTGKSGILSNPTVEKDLKTFLLNRHIANCIVLLSTAVMGSVCIAAEKLPSVTVDCGKLAKTSHIATMRKTANHSDEPPFMNGEPEHLRVSFGDDKLTDYSADLQRQLLVYPLPSYAVLFHGKEKAEFDRIISQLKKLIAAKSDKGAKTIPMLPAVEAAEVFHNHVKFLKFKDGSGVGYLTSYAQDEAPLKNGDFYYSFQGLSADEKYYVSLQYPVKAPKLPAATKLKPGVDYLNRLPDSQFVPSLTEIDKLVQSISVK